MYSSGVVTSILFVGVHVAPRRVADGEISSDRVKIVFNRHRRELIIVAHGFSADAKLLEHWTEVGACAPSSTRNATIGSKPNLATFGMQDKTMVLEVYHGYNRLSDITSCIITVRVSLVEEVFASSSAVRG
jgi:hypothetical protein